MREVVHLLVIALVNGRWPKNLRAELTVLLLLEVVEPSQQSSSLPPGKGNTKNLTLDLLENLWASDSQALF